VGSWGSWRSLCALQEKLRKELRTAMRSSAALRSPSLRLLAAYAS